MNLVKDSSGKIIGATFINENKIVIDNFRKPLYEIKDKDIITKVLNQEDEGIIILFDEYFLLISEIASLYKTNYRTINDKINDFKRQNKIKTNNKEGRRNSSFAQKFGEERRKHIGDSRRGKPATWKPYERTPEIKAKIAQTLHEGFSSGRIKMNTEALSKAWADGKYKNSPMGRGIQGFFESKKHIKGKDVYFRSLLELKFLIMIEEKEDVTEFKWEPFTIKMEDNRHYTPDCLIGNTLIELKPRKHLLYSKDKINNRFQKEVEAAQKYCKENGLIFKIIYDDEIDFDSNKFRRYFLNNPEIIEKYNIRFNKELKRY